MQNGNSDFLNQDYEVTELNQREPSTNDLIDQKGLMQTKAQYTTAVQVIKPRNIEEVIKRVEREAELAGEEFYYSYPQGGKYIEGTAIGGAQILARNWGNCAVNSRIIDSGDKIIVYGDFIDFETGFNLTRPFIGKKKVQKNRQGKEIYDRDRNDEIVAQIHISKALRNVILNSIPNFVEKAALRKAKSGMRIKLESYVKQNGMEKAREVLLERAGKLNIDQDKLEGQFGKVQKWDIDKLLRINSILKGIEDGYQTVNDAFNIDNEQQKQSKNQDGSEKQQKKEEGKQGQKKQQGKPEVEYAETSDDNTPDPESNKGGKKEYSVEEWENPDKVVEIIFDVYDSNKTGQENIKKLYQFKKENKNRLDSFGGKDYEKVVKALEQVENKALNQKNN